MQQKRALLTLHIFKNHLAHFQYIVAKTMHKKSSFPLDISSVNVIKSAGIFRFNHIY